MNKFLTLHPSAIAIPEPGIPWPQRDLVGGPGRVEHLYDGGPSVKWYGPNIFEMRRFLKADIFDFLEKTSSLYYEISLAEPATRQLD